MHICKCLPRSDIYNNNIRIGLLNFKKGKFQCVSNPIHLLTLISHAYPFHGQRPKMVRHILKKNLAANAERF